MSGKYEDMRITLPVTGRNGNLKLSAVMDGDTLKWDSMSIRYGLVDGEGVIPEETDKQHTHEYDQMVWFLSSDPNDMMNLGAELEIDLGSPVIRHKIAIPSAICIPKGTVHFSPIVTKVDRPFFYFSISCTKNFSAAVTDANAVPMVGEWNKFFGEFSKCIKSLSFSANDPYHYGSARNQSSGGVSTFFEGSSAGVPLTVAWSTVCQEHRLGPWGADGEYHPHTHQDFDEALIFFSLDTDNLTELHCSADYSVGEEGNDQECYELTKATVMAMRKGTPHLPLLYRNVTAPSVFVTASLHRT